MKSISKKINLNSIKSVGILFSGSLIALLISFITAPIITRIFSTQDIGIYSYILSVVTTFWPVLNGRYDMMIVSESSDEQSFSLIKLSSLIGVGISLLVGITFSVYIYLSKSNIPLLSTILFIPTILISLSFHNILSAYNNRGKKYKVLAISNVIKNLIQYVGPVLIGIIHPSANSLLIAYLVGIISSVLYQYKELKNHLKYIISLKIKDLINIQKKYSKQPIFSAPAILANTLSYSLITFFIEYLYDLNIVGYYSISTRLLGVPLSLISGNVAKVFYEEASSEYKTDGTFKKSFKKYALFLIPISVVMVLIMMLFAPKLFGLFLGKDWAVAGEYVRILAPMFGINFVVSPLTLGILIVQKQKLELFLQLFYLFASIGAFTLTKFLTLPVESYLTLVTAFKSIVLISFFIVLLKYSLKVKERN